MEFGSLGPYSVSTVLQRFPINERTSWMRVAVSPESFIEISTSTLRLCRQILLHHKPNHKIVDHWRHSSYFRSVERRKCCKKCEYFAPACWTVIFLFPFNIGLLAHSQHTTGFHSSSLFISDENCCTLMRLFHLKFQSHTLTVKSLQPKQAPASHPMTSSLHIYGDRIPFIGDLESS